MAEHDKVLLESFGYSYNSAGDRAVSAYIRYLADLSAEHQQMWRTRELGGDYKLHPDFYRATILGEWPERVPIIDAILMEMCLVNEMTRAMKGQPLFREEFKESRPTHFSLLVRPTSKGIQRVCAHARQASVR